MTVATKDKTTGLLTKAGDKSVTPIEPVKPLLDTSAATVPQGMDIASGPTVNTAGQSYTPTAYTQQVDPTQTTQGLLSRVLDSGSELMRQAEHRGQASATRRGLGNSSIAAQASMGAMIDAALPIAQADAQLYQTQNLTNQQAVNTAAGAANQFLSDDMKMRQEKQLVKLRTQMQNAAVDNEFRNRVLGQYMDGVNNVMNNPDMSPEQKNASIEKMYENLRKTISMQGATSGLNLKQYKPGGTGAGGGTGTGSGGGGSGTGLPPATSMPKASAPLSEQLDYVTRGTGISQQDAMRAVSAGAPLIIGGKQIIGFSEGVKGQYTDNPRKYSHAVYQDKDGSQWLKVLSGATPLGVLGQQPSDGLYRIPDGWKFQ